MNRCGGKRICLVGVPTEADGDSSEPLSERLGARDEMVQTLIKLLRVAGVRVTPVKKPLAGFKPRNYIVAGDDHPKAEAYFEKFDLVYFAEDHPSVAFKFIERHARKRLPMRARWTQYKQRARKNRPQVYGRSTRALFRLFTKPSGPCWLD